MFTANPTTVAWLLGVVIPIIVGIVVKSNAAAKVKVLANIVVSAFAALLVNSLNDAGYAVISWDMLQVTVQQIVVSSAAYLGFYKPLNVSSSLLPDKGFGKPQEG